MKDPENTQFEPLIKELGTVIESIENDQSNIANSLAAYESGVRLVRLAQSYLTQAEQRVAMLSAEEDNSEPSFEE